MKVRKTERNTYEIEWKQGQAEINLVAVNPAVKGSIGARPSAKGRLLYIHDNIGIVGLKLKDCPAVPKILWDNREHHFWRGFNGGFTPRNAIVNDVSVTPTDEHDRIEISFYYVADFVKTTMKWAFVEPQNGAFAQWDTHFSFENLSPFELEDYMTFFACYHKPGQNYFWNKEDTLVECADAFRGYASKAARKRETEIMAPYKELVKGWTGPCKNPTRENLVYGKPVLTSDRTEWFNDGRHAFMADPRTCMAVASAMTQARDYLLAPPERNLAAGASFTSRVRHIIADIDSTADLKMHWDAFARDFD